MRNYAKNAKRNEYALNIDLKITKKQKLFIDAPQFEVLYGGAAGGGKSFGQMIDALLYALKYPNSKQLILRRTFAELDKSLIRKSLELYPKEIYTYNSSTHTGRFQNGSIIDFGYCAAENDVYQYQSAEYDVIRFDELTHFTKEQYVYLISRVRGANNYPKQVKSATNPGGVGHTWVKERFIDPAPPFTPHAGEGGLSRVFIPAKLYENKYLMADDPDYEKRLLAQSEKDRKALLEGCWDIFEGMYFPEWKREMHVCRPFDIPKEWRRYRAFDYGLDRLACYYIAISSTRECYVYKEVCESNLPISQAARMILEAQDKEEDIYATLAPPDMWSRSQESGKSKADVFYGAGLRLTKSSNNREAGWLALKELMLPDTNGVPRLHVFENCVELIRCIPALAIDSKRPTDCATEPHDVTHAPDALRYFAVYWHRPGEAPDTAKRVKYSDSMYEDWLNADSNERAEIERMCGGKPQNETSGLGFSRRI